MRNRFFLIIVSTLILSVFGINVITTYFFRTERINLIDQQITRSANTLLESDVLEKPHAEDSAEDLISAVLGSDRIGKVFIIRTTSGKILYQSINVLLLQADLPMSPDWITLQAKDQYVRIFNAKLPRGRVLQVGLVLDQNFINWRIVDTRTAVFIGALTLILLVVAIALTLTLLSPIRLLNSHLLTATADLKNLKDVGALPAQLLKFSGGGFWAQSDEFASLVSTVKKLIDRINLNYKLTRSWTLQMAHELKTPLAIMRSETESLSGQLPKHYSESVLREIEY